MIVSTGSTSFLESFLLGGFCRNREMGYVQDPDRHRQYHAPEGKNYLGFPLMTSRNPEKEALKEKKSRV